MIAHIVVLQLRPDYDHSELSDIMCGLAALQIAGFTAFRHGPNRDVENKTPEFPYGLICDFTDLDALHRYAADATHKALGARLCALCVGGGDGISAMDLEL